MTISAFDDPILSALLGDEEVAQAFSVEADVRAMLAFEAALASAQAALGLIPQELAAKIAEVCATFSPDVQALREGVAKDGVVAPTLVKVLRERVGEPHAAKVHFGATSQDVIDTSLVLRLKPIVASFGLRIHGLIESLRAIEAEQGATPLMGRTRMQRALPITAADKLRAWRAPLERHRDRLPDVARRLLVVQFGGPVGARGGLEGRGDAVAAGLARLLELGDGPCWHVERDGLAEFASWLSLVSGSLGKIGAGRRDHGAERDRRGSAVGRRRLLGDAAQIQPGACGNARHARALQRDIAWGATSRSRSRERKIGRGVDAGVARAASDGRGDRRVVKSRVGALRGTSILGRARLSQLVTGISLSHGARTSGPCLSRSWGARRRSASLAL